MKKVYAIVLCLISLCTLHAAPVMAEPSVTEQPLVQIVSEYSANIQPGTSDIFTIEYKYVNGTQTATMQLDASTICEHAGTINMPPGDYQIVSIQYQGTSQAIINEGYAVSSKFSTQNTTGYIYLKIGHEKVTEFENTYEDVLSVVGSVPQTIATSGTLDNVTAIESESSANTGETEMFTDAASNNTAVDQQQEKQESPSVEHYNDEKNNSSDQTLHTVVFKIAIVTGIFLIAMIVLFIFHKKGKI